MPNSLELNVSPALLHTFANHPFHVRKDMEMNELVDSIRESGVIVPLIVRSRPEGGYEIISGHRRCEACRELGIEKVPVRVQELTDDEATILFLFGFHLWLVQPKGTYRIRFNRFPAHTPAFGHSFRCSRMFSLYPGARRKSVM